jgi:hypothetical protein
MRVGPQHTISATHTTVEATGSRSANVRLASERLLTTDMMWPMPSMGIRFVVAIISIISTLHVAPEPQHRAAAVPAVQLLRVPDGAVQPRAVVDSAGVVHALYFRGDRGQGDVFYSRADSGGTLPRLCA